MDCNATLSYFFFASLKVNPVAYEVADQGGKNNDELELQVSFYPISTNNENLGGHDDWSYNDSF